MIVLIPNIAWSRVLDEFAATTRDVERVAYLDGSRIGELSVVTTVTIPHARLEALRFSVPAEAMSEAGKHLRRFGLRRIAQVHTHRDGWTGHSPWDDKLAYSQTEGALSLVLPNNGRRPSSPIDAGVHIRGELGWHECSRTEKEELLKVVPSFLDFRSA